MITTTLSRIREHSQCKDEWANLLAGLGKTTADDEPLPFTTILAINGLDDALWCCRAEPQHEKEWRLLMVAYARRVEHLNTNPNVKNAIDVAERHANGEATNGELHAARANVWAVRAAARAARDAAMAAGNAARAAAGDEVWFAARAARDAAAGAAARVIPQGPQRMPYKRAAWEAERKWQEQEFLRVVGEKG
jgi:hypothetical protein